MKAMGWSLMALLTVLLLLRGRRADQALPSRQRGFMFAPALFSSGGITDPYFSNVVLLCQFETGTTDKSQAPKVVTVGNGAISATTPLIGMGSLLLSAGYVSAAVGDVLSGDFTIEFAFAGAENRVFLYGSGGGVSWYLYSDGLKFNDVQIIGNLGYMAPLNAGSTVKIAIARQGATVRVFVNGVLKGSATNNQSWALGTLLMGVYPPNDSGNWARLTGRLDGLRITKGVARYTAAYTPAAISFPEA